MSDVSRLLRAVAQKVLSNPETRQKLYNGVKNAGNSAQRIYNGGFAEASATLRRAAASVTGSHAAGSAASSGSSTSSGASSTGGSASQQHQQSSSSNSGAAGTGFTQKMRAKVQDWQTRAADPKRREETLRQLIGFITMNFMGLVMLFQLGDGLYKSWKRGRIEAAKRQQLAEQRQLEQEKMRRLAHAAQTPQQNNVQQQHGGLAVRPQLEAVGNAADQVTWASMRGRGWALADGGVLVGYERVGDPLERTELSKWAIGGADDLGRMSAPSGIDPLYGVKAHPPALM